MEEKIGRVKSRCKASLTLVRIGCVLYGLLMILTVINIIAVAVVSESKLAVTFANGEWRYDNALIGMGRISQDMLHPYADAYSARTFIMTHNVIGLLTHELPIFIILLLAWKILKQVTEDYTPFNETISKRLHMIGTIIILMGVFSRLIMQLGMSTIVLNRVYVMNPLQIGYVLIGLLVYILADIFSYGSWLQKEQDELI